MPKETAPNPTVSLLDLLQPSNSPHRFKAGDVVRATIVGTDERTGLPANLVHRQVELPEDRQVKIISAHKGEARYVAELLPEQPIV